MKGFHIYPKICLFFRMNPRYQKQHVCTTRGRTEPPEPTSSSSSITPHQPELELVKCLQKSICLEGLQISQRFSSEAVKHRMELKIDDVTWSCADVKSPET